MKIERISSAQNARFRHAIKLHTSRGRNSQQRILVIGHREVERAFQSGLKFEEIFFDDRDQRDEALTSLIQRGSGSSRCFALDAPLLQQLGYGDREVKIVGIAARPDTTLEKLTNQPQISHANSFVLVLEGLEKPGNLGAIARSADAGGAAAILLADPRTDIFHPNAIRASVATVFSIPIATGNSGQVRAWLEQHRYRICYATPEAKQSLYQTQLTGKVAIVIGNEAAGISPGWKQGASTGLQVPMSGVGDSLNASVTAALLIYEAYRQRVEGQDV